MVLPQIFKVSLYSPQPQCLDSFIITPTDSVGIIPAPHVLSSIWLFGTLWAHHASLTLGFSRQEYCSESQFSYPGDLPNSGIKPMSPVWHVVSLPLSYLGCPWGRTQKWQIWSWHRLKNKIFLKKFMCSFFTVSKVIGFYQLSFSIKKK